jgi:hypothetical protein
VRTPSLPPELVAVLADRQDGGSTVDPKIAILSQKSNIGEIERMGSEEWTILYSSEPGSGTTGGKCFYSALIPRTRVRKAMKKDSWEVMIDNGLPGFSRGYDGDKVTTRYDRFGFSQVEPLVFVRGFHGLKPRQFDLLEEFRHFNLYHDRKNDRYIFIDERGEDEVVVEVSDARVRVKTRYVKQFMAARQLYLAVYFDHRTDTTVNIEVAKQALPPRTVVEKDLRYSFNVSDLSLSPAVTFSRLVGKKIIAPPPTEECGVWPFETRRDQFAEFIIGVDANGRDILHTGDEDELANYFGRNPGSPHYLTPVWFRREALRKYYDNPDKYSVEDGYVRCGGLWGLRMDNDLRNHVVVFLGDLGKLHYDEQLYWKSFNIPPVANRSSEVHFKRSYLAEFADPVSPDLVLKQKLAGLQDAWEHRYGWQLFRPLQDDDAHVVKQIRIPLSDTTAEFDHQVLLLAKLLVDSLDDARLVKELGGALPDERSIGKFDRFLVLKEYPHRERDIKLLRAIQAARSTGAAHRRGEHFQKIRTELQLDEKEASDVFRQLLSRVNQMLADLLTYFVPEAIPDC